MRLVWILFAGALCWVQAGVQAEAQAWVPQQSGTAVSLRGVSAASATVVWASGSGGVFLRTTDGGKNWRAGKIPGAADLDFRGIQTIDDQTALLLSAGEGEKSRVYKTTNGGAQWRLLYTNPDPDGFFDAIAFWDAAHGIILGDPVNGRFVILTTDDGGVTWKRRKGPKASDKEGAFAASNSCLALRGTREAWFGTGAARVFHSTDGGETWSDSKTPVRKDSASAGIFSLAFSAGRHGVAVGGDYQKPAEAESNIALTNDAGKTWAAPKGARPNGFRSGVVYLPDRKMWIATGTSGSDFSTDDGETWKKFDSAAYNALTTSSGAVWAVGPKGAIARLKD